MQKSQALREQEILRIERGELGERDHVQQALKS